jgi:glycosyltransferase involved in cell wall biosynthesis
MRILTVTHYQLPHWGGIEMTAAALHERYRRMGHESVWLSSDLPPVGPVPPGYLRVPASDLLFDTVGVAYPLWGRRAAALLRERIDWCDIVNPHDCLYSGTVLALRDAARTGKPLVLTQHAGPWPFYRSRALRAVQLAAYQTLGLAVHRRVAQAVFISRAVQTWFGARVRYPRPPRFIPNGVDTAVFTYGDAVARRAARERLGLPFDRRIVVYVGRFLFMKGLPVIEQVARRQPDSLFVLIGDGPIDPRHWRLPNVVVQPFQPQAGLRDYYWAGDVLILPSTGEGFPLVVMEAMVCGTPAIVSAETYAAWNEGREWFLVAEPMPTAESVGALLASHDRLLDPDGREAISAYARAHWDWDQVARSYVTLMAEVLGEMSGDESTAEMRRR